MADITFSGPLFDGRAALAVRDLCSDAEDNIGARAVELVRGRLNVVLKHQTGTYRMKVHKERRAGWVTISDGDIIYGNWLEGVGERNKTTRFKGYWSFRKSASQLKKEAPAIVEGLLTSRYLGRMN